MPVTAAMPSPMVSEVRRLLRGQLTPLAEVLTVGEPAANGVLLLAAHEQTESENAAVLARDWSWVHLTSAGSDLISTRDWSDATLLTRSWRCYAAPLTEYVLHAVLTAEWARGAPWQREVPEVGAGPGLFGSTIGVAGWGEVGRRVTTALTSLGVHVRVLRRSTQHPSAEHQSVEYVTDLDDLLDVDHLVLALPLTDTTRGLISRTWLSRTRPGMHLINVSRGALVDQNALTELCASGRLRATLDVTEPEPLPPDHPLRHLASVRVSDHMAWSSRRSNYAFVEDFLTIWRCLASADRVPGLVCGDPAARARPLLTNASVDCGDSR